MELSSLQQDNFDVFEDWRDLSQYSYDPEDRLETLTLPDSQPSSQESEKTDVFFGMAEEEAGLIFSMPVCVNSIIEAQPVLTEDTGDLGEHSVSPTGVRGWLARSKGVSTVANSQELQSVLLWEDNCHENFAIQVSKMKLLFVTNLYMQMHCSMFRELNLSGELSKRVDFKCEHFRPHRVREMRIVAISVPGTCLSVTLLYAPLLCEQN